MDQVTYCQGRETKKNGIVVVCNKRSKCARYRKAKDQNYMKFPLKIGEECKMFVEKERM